MLQLQLRLGVVDLQLAQELLPTPPAVKADCACANPRVLVARPLWLGPERGGQLPPCVLRILSILLHLRFWARLRCLFASFFAISGVSYPPAVRDPR